VATERWSERRPSQSEFVATHEWIERIAGLVEVKVHERMEQRTHSLDQRVGQLGLQLAELANLLAKQLTEHRQQQQQPAQRPSKQPSRTTEADGGRGMISHTHAHPRDVQRSWLATQERVSARDLIDDDDSDMAVQAEENAASSYWSHGDSVAADKMKSAERNTWSRRSQPLVTSARRCQPTKQSTTPRFKKSQPHESDDKAPPAPKSLASFCIEQAMAPLGPTADGFVATLQMVSMTFFQYILTHGFFDSVWLEDTVKDLAPYAETIASSELYIMRPCPGCPVPHGFDRTFSFGCTTDPAGVTPDTCDQRHPRMKVLTGFAALSLFALGPILMDDQQTVFTKQPLDYLLFDERPVHEGRKQPGWHAGLCFLWRLATALLLQAWSPQTHLCPPFATLAFSPPSPRCCSCRRAGRRVCCSSRPSA
jgi:hypothetical protein